MPNKLSIPPELLELIEKREKERRQRERRIAHTIGDGVPSIPGDGQDRRVRQRRTTMRRADS